MMKKISKRPLRKKPTQQRSQNVFDSIIQAAQILLNTEGLAGFTTNKVAKKAGVSIGSLYQYFPNKETIMEKILMEIFTRFLDDAISLANSTTAATVEDFIEIQLRTSWDSCIAHTLMMRSLFQISKSDELVRHIIQTRWAMIEKLASVVHSQFKPKTPLEDLKSYLFGVSHNYIGLTEAYCYILTDPALDAHAKQLDSQKMLSNFINMVQKGLPA